MNWPIFLASSPVGVVLLKWTALLALAWVTHWLLRNSHPRWRLILWRGLLCLGLLLLLVPLLPAPVFSIAIPTVHAPEISSADLPVAGGQAIQTPSSPTRSAAKQVETAKSPIDLRSSLSPISPEQGSGSRFLLMIWLCGGICGAIRLFWLQIELSRLRNAANLVGPTLHNLAREIQAKLGVKRTIEIRVSDSIVSPFICGPLKPIIMLPQTLARSLSSVEVSALLSHEIAHFRQRDLIWCLGWRWMQAFCWFHPLVWHVPAAHNLACEEEADRIACAQFGDRRSYAQWLAQLTLRVLALPAVETGLALNGTAQIVQRLNRLKRQGLGAWKWWCSAVGVAVLGLFFFLIYGSTDEPTYHFRSVTQWLDRMAMFDELRTMDEQGRSSYTVVFPPEVVTNDPALRALLAMGAKAVPTLEKILNEPPHDSNVRPSEDPIQRVKSWMAGIWQQVRGGGPVASNPALLRYGSFQGARMAAAGLAMLALGTNNHAGALRLLEIAAAMRSKGCERLGSVDAFSVAHAGLPEQHKEIVAGIVAGLNDTNPQIQFTACAATQEFHTNLPEWKKKLMELAQGPDVNVTLPLGLDTYVSERALWSLACAGRKDGEIVDLCEKAVQDKTRPPHLRAFAAAGLGFAGDKAEHTLPLLRAVLTEQGIPKGSGLTGAAREAIDSIEKSLALRNAKGDSTATGK